MGRPRQKQRLFVISIRRLHPLETEETTYGGNTEHHPDRKLTPPDTLQYTRLPSPVSQFVFVSFARHNKSLRREGNHHQQSNNGRTVGVPIQPKHEVSNSIFTWRLAPSEDKDEPYTRKPIKGQWKGGTRGKDGEGKKKAENRERRWKQRKIQERKGDPEEQNKNQRKLYE